eukprot:1601389-Pyramimonas_sp.AAC.1
MTWPRGRAGPSPPSGGNASRWSWPRVWRVACCARPSARLAPGGDESHRLHSSDQPSTWLTNAITDAGLMALAPLAARTYLAVLLVNL